MGGCLDARGHDSGINAKKVAPQDPQLAKLHAEEQFFECRARIAGLKRTILTFQTDIQQKQAQITAAETEIRRLEDNIKTLGTVT